MDEDEALRQAIQASLQGQPPVAATDDDEELKRAIALSLGEALSQAPGQAPGTGSSGSAAAAGPAAAAAAAAAPTGGGGAGATEISPENFLEPSQKAPSDVFTPLEKLLTVDEWDADGVGGAADSAGANQAPVDGRGKLRGYEETAYMPGEGAPSGGAVTPSEVPPATLQSWMSLVFGSNPKEVDVHRWLWQGFQFDAGPLTRWGLRQKQGGPCGVLAPLQCLLLGSLLFGLSGTGARGEGEAVGIRMETGEAGVKQSTKLPGPLSAGALGHRQRWAALINALAYCLFQATCLSSYRIVALRQLRGDPEAEPLPFRTVVSEMKAWTFSFGSASDLSKWLASPEGLALLRGPTGVLSLVLSLVHTRGEEKIRTDVDDPENPLVGMFGHCSQELVNLLLTGRAHSNVFDNVKSLGDGMDLVLKGILSETTVGYLSELEVMRYTEVGTHLKHPRLPVWVLGSPDHYVSVFAADRKVALQSVEDLFETKALRVFRKYDTEHAGFVSVAFLEEICRELGARTKKEVDEVWVGLGKPQDGDMILWSVLSSLIRQKAKEENTARGARSPPEKFVLFLYDGQDPPGPNVSAWWLERTDVDLSQAQPDGADASLAAVAQTVWKGALLTEVEIDSAEPSASS
uniref:ubiquitinyl hydrolase 1 n=1 Tax=Chromera velia CCMP2878 TaxID=1169474 RepID=A0A0G4HNW5_9ALVE|eukprot:Cvel_7707.t1-p1 / transcript=Cvel_7707.t1 / gene=Cvel_7707 / organism=Chromera_velia_CCMP2878 / gene_product=Protein FAM188A, putative / transcript_product=Protein FAM188A, putative / location=Cvel_scaffold409:51559-58964(+) / protein_length=631 / sequence_SO=supercontig / SO=protein_coding / is_pseudo=false